MTERKPRSVLAVGMYCGCIGLFVAIVLLLLDGYHYVPSALNLPVFVLCPPILLVIHGGGPIDLDQLIAIGIAAVCNAAIYGVIGVVVWLVRRENSQERDK
ncbi:MAG: hypothetical protein ACLQGT_13555 [Terracidiphilus sp.]